jgi:hypothetical protein
MGDPEVSARCNHDAFPTTGEGGHGHHTASAILANEAFVAAADKSRFPEQLKWVQPWQATRIVWNTFNFGSTNTTSEEQHKIDVGGYNPCWEKAMARLRPKAAASTKARALACRAAGEKPGNIFQNRRRGIYN